MDNVTHTLAGVLVAHTWNRAGAKAKAASPAEKRGVFWASVIGSNLPDLDYVARYLGDFWGSGQDSRLAYLLHHRGFTHTLLFLPLIALVSAALARLISRSGNFRKLVLVAAVALWVHFAADYCNDYGVHPFSPFFDRWFYGDTLFILEPTLWLAMIPWAVELASTRVTAAIWSVFGVGIVVAAWILPVISFPAAVALTLWGALVAAAQFFLRGKRGMWPAWGALVLALWVFVVTGAIARARAKESLQRLAPTEQFTDFILTPMPANPFCRRLIALSIDGEGTYRARIGAQSLWGRAFPPEKCVFRFEAKPGAEIAHAAPWDEPTLPLPASAQDGIFWQGEFSGSLDLMLELIRANCKFAAALHFARAPFWTAGSSGKLLVGDLRYDRGKDGGFAAFEVQGREECPWFLPTWEMPFFRHYRPGGWE